MTSYALVDRNIGIGLKVRDGEGEWKQTEVYQTIKERQEQIRGAENARLLYVALTRARDYLVIMGPEGGSTKGWTKGLSLKPPPSLS